MLFTPHDMGLVSEIADDVTVLKLGEVIETQAVESLLRHPRARLCF